jgi:hypothetical protein
LQTTSTPGAIKNPGTDTTSSLVNAWKIVPEDRRDYHPHRDIIEPRKVPPPPPATAIPAARPDDDPAEKTASPTQAPTPAPTTGNGGNLDVLSVVAEPIGALGVQWVSYPFGVQVLGAVPCTEVSVRAAAGTLASFLDRNGDGLPENMELVNALAESKVGRISSDLLIARVGQFLLINYK